MRPLVFFLLALGPTGPALAGQCGSIVPSVCVQPLDETPARKVLRVTQTVLPFAVGDRFPVEKHSLVMDPARYDLTPSDGSWRYYAVAGVVYRVDNVSSVVLEVIRSRLTTRLR